MSRKIRPRYGIDPVQEVSSYSFTDIQIERLLAALPFVCGDRAEITQRLERYARTYLWLRNQYQDKPTRAEQNAALADINQRAADLAKILPGPDLETEWELLSAATFQVDELADFAERLEILADAATQTLHVGKKRAGPRMRTCVHRILPDCYAASKQRGPPLSSPRTALPTRKAQGAVKLGHP